MFGRKESAAPPRPGLGVPGVPGQEGVEPELAAMLLRGEVGKPPIGKEEIAKAAELLSRYKDGKKMLESRVVEDELWWELRHWEVMRRAREGKAQLPQPQPTSAWLFNAITNKHADAMDNYPEPVVLPRERSDEESARTLSSVLPVVLEYNDYEQTYSQAWWEKLKHGTAAYGVFWNSRKENGLGDIDIRGIDLLKLFWEPGITDIQDSRNLFLVELVDEELLEQRYPQHKGHLGGSVIDLKQYVYDDTVDTSGKSLVVDWYYKVRAASGRTILHYAKFVGDTLLFASENEEAYRERGWYDHGEYPVVMDVLFPEKGTPAGFGYVAICKDPQLYIDKMSANVLENAMMSTKKRFFLSTSTAVNREQFLDWNEPIVDVEGELDDRRLQEIVTQPLSSIYLDIMNLKIEEMKDTASNRDVNSGGTGSGVTAAAAIAALQEAGNKVSRDMIATSYRAHVKVSAMCIELMRQFYDEERAFRITGETPGSYRFVEVSNAGLKDVPLDGAYPGQQVLYRKPVFDIKISAQKKNPFSRMEQNERAKELYGLGFFNPERAQEAMGALEMMDFEGIDKVRQRLSQGQTLLKLCQQLSEQLGQLTALMGEQGAAAARSGGEGRESAESPAGNQAERSVVQAQTPREDYTASLAKRSAPQG
ncbi:MAG TPA: hypothetical protein IAA94_00660 [Candidatus Galloscillospira stercoripullorum]|nr:hypothetical protein [Candidatus Galloscillospira stercoripullorum]